METDTSFDPNYYIHSSEGYIVWDTGPPQKKHHKPYWARVRCDQAIIDYYAWLLLKHGVTINKGSEYGAHISFLKSEEPVHKDKWGMPFPVVNFYYSHTIRYDNNIHAWLDVWCPLLHKIRSELGLSPKMKQSFHLTIGRLT